jgi:hypothetical protein
VTTLARRLLAVVALLGPPGAQAAGGMGSFDAEAGASVRRFGHDEWRDDGARLNRERGELAGLRLSLVARRDWGSLAATASRHEGSVGYRGLTQAGSPVATSTDVRIHEALLLVRSHPIAGGRLSFGSGVGLREWQRTILGTARVAGLRETYRAADAVLESSALLYEGTHGEVVATLRIARAFHARVDVDFGGLFDTARIPLSAQRSVAVEVAWSMPLGTRSSLVLRPHHERWTIARSSAQQLTRAGAQVGQVNLPRGSMAQTGLMVGWRYLLR